MCIAYVVYFNQILWHKSKVGPLVFLIFLQGQASDVLRDGKGLADVHSQSCFPSSMSNMSAPLTRSLDIPPPIMASPSRYLIYGFFHLLLLSDADNI